MGEVATLWTIGHSTRGWEEFLALLATQRIEAIADVRRFPGSRRHPWFASETMAANLPASGVDYLWLPQLGGRRRVQPGSPNGGWRNAAFQGYADHLQSAEFADGLQRLLQLAERRRTALMCAEALWWRCHRRLIADVLSERGIAVLHILDAGHVQPHVLSESAQVVDGRLIYPPPQQDLFGAE
ncbi:MAG: DUF488 domain-containing protein [Stenotrophomonas sp.]